MTARGGWTCVDCGAWCSSTIEHVCGEKPVGCALCDEIFVDIPAWARHANAYHGGAILHGEVPMNVPESEILDWQPRLV